jgi:hypothetical protein
MALEKATRYNEAISIYQQALDIDPKNVTVLNNKGVALTHLGLYEEAIKEYDKALDIDPTFKLAANNKLWAMNKLNPVNFVKYENSGMSINIPSDWAKSESSNSIGVFSPYESNSDNFPEAIWININNLTNQSSTLNDLSHKNIDSLTKDHAPSFNIIDSNLDSNISLGGYPSYERVSTYTEGKEFGNCRDVCNLKSMIIGTIVGGKEYDVEYYAEDSEFGNYLPTVKKIIDSFKVTSIDLLNDNFDTENDGNSVLNYSSFQNWNVVNGTVDLMSHALFNNLPPINGLYIDLDGSSLNAGKIETKKEFNLQPGNYTLEFDIAGYSSNDTNTIIISLGNVFHEKITRQNEFPFEHIIRKITINENTTARLAFDHLGGDNFGLLLDNVKLIKTNR